MMLFVTMHAHTSPVRTAALKCNDTQQEYNHRAGYTRVGHKMWPILFDCLYL